MSDLIQDNLKFDVEAQESLLQQESSDSDHLEAAVSEREQTNKFRTLLLLFTSAEVFKLKLGSAEISAGDEAVADPLLQNPEEAVLVDVSREQDEVDVSGEQVEDSPPIEPEPVVSKTLHIIHPTSPYKTSFFCCVFGACKDSIIILLLAALSLSVGFEIDEKGIKAGLCNEIAPLFIVFVLVSVKIWQNYNSEKKKKKSTKSLRILTGNRMMKVLVKRGDSEVFVPTDQLQVGDMVILQKGDQVPCDGIFVPDEDQSQELHIAMAKNTIINKQNPRLSYGSRVLNGTCLMTVTAVGMETMWGEMMRDAVESFHEKSEFTSNLHKIETWIIIVVLVASIAFTVVSYIHYKSGHLDGYNLDPRGEPTNIKNILAAIKGVVTGQRWAVRVFTMWNVSLVGMVETGSAMISFAICNWNYSTLADHKASARDYLSCIKMASVTVIVTDKFGGLTEHEIQTNKIYIGEEFVSESSDIAHSILERLWDGICTLSLLHIGDCEPKVESLVSWFEAELGMKKEPVKEKCTIIRHRGCNPFSECCQALMEKSGNGGEKRYLHCNGPPADILSRCSFYYDKGDKRQMNAEKREVYEKAIEMMTAETKAEVVAYAFKDVNIPDDELEAVPSGLIFLGMISLATTKREDTKRAVSTLMQGGIRTILVSEDHNIATLETIGRSCGLFDTNNLVIAAEQFRAWSDEEKLERVGNIVVMGDCLSSDKIDLIKCLRKNRDVVALVGQRTFDAPLLKLADVGITYGTWSSDVARESADIDISDGDFRFLVDVIKKARCFLEKVCKYIQLHLTITISCTSINLASLVFIGECPISTIQIIWLNIVIPVFGGLVFLLGPSEDIPMENRPAKSSISVFITISMLKTIGIQACYYTLLFVFLQKRGHALFDISRDRLKLMVYNGFFSCQLFSIILPADIKSFKSIFCKNWWSVVAAVFMILICQAAFAIAQIYLDSRPGLSWKLWLACVVIGFSGWVFYRAQELLSFIFWVLLRKIDSFIP